MTMTAYDTILEAAVELDQIARDFKRCNTTKDGSWDDHADNEYHDGLVDLVQRLRAVAKELPR